LGTYYKSIIKHSCRWCVLAYTTIQSLKKEKI